MCVTFFNPYSAQSRWHLPQQQIEEKKENLGISVSKQTVGEQFSGRRLNSARDNDRGVAICRQHTLATINRHFTVYQFSCAKCLKKPIPSAPSREKSGSVSRRRPPEGDEQTFPPEPYILQSCSFAPSIVKEEFPMTVLSASSKTH